MSRLRHNGKKVQLKMSNGKRLIIALFAVMVIAVALLYFGIVKKRVVATKVVADSKPVYVDVGDTDNYGEVPVIRLSEELARHLYAPTFTVKSSTLNMGGFS